jgi:hypothetical protein
MKKLKGKFTQRNGQPIEKGVLVLELSQHATLNATGEEVWEDLIKIPLDEEGRIPPGAEIIANDELRPAGTYYHVDVVSDACGNCYDEILKIVGASPIDLNALTPESKRPDKVYEPDPEPEPKPVAEPIAARLHAEDRCPPTRRTPSENNIGFFAGTINCPIDNDSGRLPFIGNGWMGVFGFSLPFPSTITCAAIHVDSAPPGTHFVLLALYGGNRRRVAEFRICVDGPGLAVGVLDSPVTLEPGDYFLGWGSSFDHVEVHTFGEKVADLTRLMNAGGGAVIAGVARTAERSLPETLGDITPARYSTPLVYFKA